MSRFLRAISCALTLLTSSASAQNLNISPGSPGISLNGGDASRTIVAVPGGRPRSQADRARDTINVFDMTGVYRDTVQVAGNSTMSSGSRNLTCSLCAFTSADVGKYIVVSHAGAAISGGSLTSVPVTSAGSYTGQPSITVTGAGTGAVVRPLMAAATAALNVGGSGYTDGTQTLTVNSSGCITPPQVSVTVSGGIVTAVNSVTVAGSCWNIDSTGSTAVTTTASAGFGATLNLTWGVASADIMTGGWGYAIGSGTVTVAVSGGTSTSAATLGTPVVSAASYPLATTISSVTDATHVVLTNAAGSAVSGFQLIAYGHDDQPAIQSSLTMACSQSPAAAVFLPGDGWGVASGLTIPNNCAISIYGSGLNVTNVRALAKPAVNPAGTAVGAAPLSSMVFKAASNGSISIRDLHLDGEHLPDVVLWLHGAHGGTISDLVASNAGPGVTNGAEIIVGDPITYFYASTLNFARVTAQDRIGSVAADLPQTAIAAYSPDNVFGEGIYGINSSVQNVMEAGGNAWHKPHVFNYPANMLAQYGMYLRSGGRIDQPYLDSVAVAGLYLAPTSGAAVLQPYCFWSSGPAPASMCAQVNGAGNYVIDRPMLGNPGFPASLAVSLTGTVRQTGVVTASIGALGTPTVTGGQWAPNGYLALDTADNTATGGNARGPWSIDLQFGGGGACRTGATQVAGGTGSVALGCGNQISTGAGTFYAVTIGGFNTVSTQAYVIGLRGNAMSLSGYIAFSSGRITSAATTPMQSGVINLGTRSTSTTPARLWVGNSQGFSNSVNIQAGSASRMDLTVSCLDVTTYADYGTWRFPVVIFARSTAASFASMAPSTAVSTFEAGTSTAQSGSVTMVNDTTLYPGPNITWTAPNSDTWDCTARALVADVL